MLSFLSSYFHLDTLLPRLFAFLLAMTLQDAVQALTASMLGDRTARRQGRLSLNPLAHIDALGLAMIVFGPYGWSKPLPVNTEHFRNKPRLCNTIVYLSGPLTNLLLVFLFWWLYFSIPSFFSNSESVMLETWRNFIQYGVIVNLMMFLIHILPLYPLDGWHVVKELVSEPKRDWMKRNERYGLILVLALMITPVGHWLLENVYPIAAQLVMTVFSL